MTGVFRLLAKGDPAAGGRAETFTAGDSFFIAKGTRCVWEITRTLRKFYMVVA